MGQDIIIRDPKGLQKKISEFKNDGAKGFHVVADFDSTLTKRYFKGLKIMSTYAHIREGKLMDVKYHKEANELFDIYYPIEQSHKLAKQFKTKKMEEWWEKHYSLMVKYGFKKSMIKEVIKKDSIHLRDNTFELFEILHKNKVPLLIFSAGLGDVIKEYLTANKRLTKNVHLIANFFKFRKGKSIGFNKPLIHTFNKKETQVQHYAYKKNIVKRKNVILLGDLIEDLDMTEGIAHDSIIRIGFLNEGIKEKLPKYKKAFDVVILNDGPMDFVNNLILEVITPHKTLS